MIKYLNRKVFEVMDLGQVFAIVNQKGGVGKTTTTINLAACIAKCGKKVLAIDIDPQGNCTTGVGIEKDGECIYDCIIDGADPKAVIQHTAYEGMDVLPSGISLAGAEVEMVDKDRREYLLKGIVDKVKDAYDYVFLDCPPSLGLLTINALTASDAVIVPIQCEFFALEGLSQLVTTVKMVKSSLNPGLYIEGVILTMFDSRTNLSSQVAEEVRRHFGSTLYTAYIPRNVRLGEAPSFAKTIIDYDSRSVGAVKYMELAQEFIDRRRSDGN